jgi:hypothetical protein
VSAGYAAEVRQLVQEFLDEQLAHVSVRTFNGGLILAG